jgi:sulfatase maturation enzyme AslB (radical SAM superfamily)
VMSAPRNMLGKHGPWAWAIEPVRGCNLRCFHCATRLFPKGKLEFMTKETWVDLWKVIRTVSPKGRVEMANAGEPTLHLDLCQFVWMARKLSPHSQIQVTTNGTTLLSGDVRYKDLFSAGVNVVYTDMYGQREEFERLARESGVLFYHYLECPEGAPGAWTYHGPDLKLIVLMDPPGKWPDSRVKLGRFGTFLNHLDWKVARKHGMKPVKEPLSRGCSQPFKYVSVAQDGSYMFCCQDFMGELTGKFGNVSDGPDGFLKFWFGEFMQRARRLLAARDRASISQCSRCRMLFSRSDFRWWSDEAMSVWWDGKEWRDAT